jgi:hypothetical protein
MTVTSAAAALLLAGVIAMRGADSAQPLSGTIYGAFSYEQEAWVGHAILQFNDGDPLKATFIDRNTSLGMRKNGAIDGTETITLEFSDGSGTFEILGQFSGTPGSTPSLYMLHETGTIANGTGRYRNLSGHVSLQGPFLFPNPEVTPGAPPWIAEIHGSTKGLQ